MTVQSNTPAILRRATWALPVLLILLLGAGLVSAGEKATGTPEQSPEARVLFVEPADGATVGTLVQFVFAAEGFTIEPVGEGEIHTGAGHFHLAIDKGCLRPGEIIPKADPWIHFGDGSAKIEVMFQPGVHRVCLQVGDGEHRTLPGLGLSKEITISVKE